ncbi:gamma-glutamyltransferase family protein [uncultured Piscinibacter sp.]|uniref:gamma-glutamyltransferase family protein n=1 Tax=uncultured Piscinibacter sp. TaxID=1131835 RepID=UPI002635011E|nr:gamma-glutamyltransferase family protein [uncultured Piscinibacter sp.]
MRPWRAALAGLALALAACGSAPPLDASAARPAAPEAAGGFVDKPGWTAARHMVAAAHPLAVQAGVQMLREGGSAVDAAVAAQMVLGLVEPQSSGLGGGLFLVHHDGRRVQAFDGRETAPAAAGPGLFLREGRPMPFAEALVGGRSVGVPGVLRALELAHRQHGRLPWARLFEPAIELADRGVPVGARLAMLLRERDARALRDDPEAAALFFDAQGEPLREGAVLRNPALAATLRGIAQRGADGFYRGEMAAAIAVRVRSHTRNPGLLGEADLAAYRAVERTPMCFAYRRWRVCGMPPPSSGTLAVGQILGMLEGRDLATLKPVPAPWGREPAPEAVHLISEAGRLAFADRARYVADPDFVPLPGLGAATLLDAHYLRQRAALIGERSMGRASPGTPLSPAVSLADDRSPEFASTTQVSVVDGFGNALSMTSTIENAFGAQIMVRGFLLNNQLTDFSFVPEVDGVPVANRVQGGKRPRSSMAPLLVFERDSGELAVSLGSPGGPAIINFVAKSLIATLDWGLDLQQAISLPNFGSRNGPTELEAGRSSEVLAQALRRRGHALNIVPLTSGVQGIQRRSGGWFGAADPRREGIAAGD